MTMNCSATFTGFTSGSYITGLVGGQSYFVEVMAISPNNGYLGSFVISATSKGV